MVIDRTKITCKGCGVRVKKRSKNNIMMLVLLVLIVILGIRCYRVTSKMDESAPIITFTDQMLAFREGEDNGKLLNDVRAIDNIDGDVSDTLIVEKIYPNEKEKKAIVTYAAIDKSYNLGKVTRVIEYEAVGEVPSVETSTEENKPTPEPTPTTEPTPTEEPVSTNGSTTSSFENENNTPSSEDSSTMIIGSKPIMYLNTNEIKINKYGKFELQDFIAGVIDDKDTEVQLLRNISKEGTYTRRVEGTYEMILYVIDSDGNESNREKVRLIVE